MTNSKVWDSPLTIDPCIYLRRSMNSIEAIAVWVDNAILATSTTTQMTSLKKEIGAIWEITDIGELCFYLGWIIERNRKEKTITISQRNYTESILKCFGMEECNPTTTPIAPGTKMERTGKEVSAAEQS